MDKHTYAIGDNSPFLLHRGFFQSVRPTVGQLTMNVDVTTGVMFKGGPLIDVCMAILGIHNVRELQGQPRRDVLRRFLKGLTFKMTRPLMGGREKVYKITDITVPASEIRFTNKEGEEITVVVCARCWYNRFMVILTDIYRTILETLAGLSSSQQSSVSKLARLNSSSPWSFANSYLANSSRRPVQTVN